MRISGCVSVRWVVLSLVLILATGCDRARPLYQVENQPLPIQSTPLSLKEIEKRIITAGQSRNWSVRALSPGRMVGQTSWKRHSAVVSIDFDETAYSIRYKSSVKLLAGKATYEGPYQGQFVIHRRYNQWVRQLKSAIDFELSLPKSN